MYSLKEFAQPRYTSQHPLCAWSCSRGSDPGREGAPDLSYMLRLGRRISAMKARKAGEADGEVGLGGQEVPSEKETGSRELGRVREQDA